MNERKSKNKSAKSKKAIGIAMAAIMVASIFATFVPVFGQRDVPVPSTMDAIYYLDPDNSSVPGYCNTTTVQLWFNTTKPFQRGEFNITYTCCCANVTADIDWSPEWEDFGATWWNCGYLFGFFANEEPPGTPKNLPPGKYLVGNITLHCCNQSCCRTDLNFTKARLWEWDETIYDWHEHNVTADNGTFTCGKPSITVDKKVWDGSAWVDEIPDADIGDEYQFRINVTATCCNFTNLWVNDTFDASMTYNDSASPAPYEEPNVGDKGGEIKWFFPTLNKSETKTMYFNVTVNDYDRDRNVANATAWCPDPAFEGWYSGEDDAYIVSAPAWEKEIYFVPQNSNASYCNTTEVEIWVNGTGMFQYGQINLTYDPDCANITDWVRNTDVFPHGDWDSSKDGEEWITFARNDEIDGKYMVGTLTIHCNNTCYCTTPLDMVDVYEVGDDVRHSELFDHNMKPIKTAWRDGNFTCTNPDLIVTEIKLNQDAKGLKDNAAGPTNHTGAKTQCNNITATIKNIGNGAAGEFYVRFNVSHMSGPEEMLCEVPVSGLNAGAETKVDCKCKWYPFAYEDYTIIVTADALNDVTECNETNNTLTRDVTPGVLGYKGDSWQDGRNITTKIITAQGHVNLRYSAGNSTYWGASDHVNWTEYAVKWVPENLSIPNAATNITARLYVYYTFGRITGDYYTPVYPEFNLTFNGRDYTMNDLIGNYTDRPSYGFNVFYNFPSGMLVYDVTDKFEPYGNNLAVLHNLREPSMEEVSMQGMVLMVIYEHENEPERIIYVNEGFDIIYARKYYGVTNEEATTYAIFNVTEDIWKFGNAKLITIAPDASQKQGAHAVSFNGVKWVGSENNPIFQLLRGGLYVDERSVKGLLKQGINIADYQSVITPWGKKKDGGDYFEVSNAFLVLEKSCAKLIYVDPEETVVQPQDQFEVDIKVNPYGIWDVYGIQYTLKYDPSVLKAESQVTGDFFGDAETIVVVNKIDHPNGIIEYAETIKGEGCIEDDGTIATIQFTAIGEPGSESYLNLTDVILIDCDKEVNKKVDVSNGTVKIFNNTPPVIVYAGTKHEKNNAQKKFECWTTLCVNVTDDDTLKGYNISYIRWSFGDGQYGTAEGGLPCNGHTGCCLCKNHSYISWKYNASGRVAPRPDHHGRPHIVKYDPFVASVTVTDDGCVPKSTTKFFDVWVFMTGDANGDGVVNILDAVWIGKHFGQTCDGAEKDTCCGYMWSSNQQSGADLNNDCRINILDAVIVGTMWGHTAY